MNREYLYRKYPEASFGKMMDKAMHILKQPKVLNILISVTVNRVDNNKQYESKAVLHMRLIDTSLQHLGAFRFDDLETKRFIELFREYMCDLDTEVYFQVNPQKKIIFKPTMGTSPLPGVLKINIDEKVIHTCLFENFQDLEDIIGYGVCGTHFEMELSTGLVVQARKCVENAPAMEMPDFASAYMDFMKQNWSKGVPPVGEPNRNGMVTDPTSFLNACRTFAENTGKMAEIDEELSKAKSIWEKNLQDGFGVPDTFSIRAQQENAREGVVGQSQVPPSDMKVYPESDPTVPTHEPSPETSIFDQAMATVQKTANGTEEAPTVEFVPSPTQEAIELDKLKSGQEMDEHMEYLKQQMEAQRAKEEAQRNADLAVPKDEPSVTGIDTSAEAKREDEAFFAESDVEDLDPNDSLAKPKTTLNE